MFLDACHREGKLLAALLKPDFRSALAPCWSHESRPRPGWLAGLLDVPRASLATGSTTFALLLLPLDEPRYCLKRVAFDNGSAIRAAAPSHH
jgi:hypothetical protein